jgi:hypothetical protein
MSTTTTDSEHMRNQINQVEKAFDADRLQWYTVTIVDIHDNEKDIAIPACSASEAKNLGSSLLGVKEIKNAVLTEEVMFEEMTVREFFGAVNFYFGNFEMYCKAKDYAISRNQSSSVSR